MVAHVDHNDDIFMVLMNILEPNLMKLSGIKIRNKGKIKISVILFM